MKLVIITDAWKPQTNGVVTTLNTMKKILTQGSMQVDIIHPGLFKTFPCPAYPEIKLAINPWKLTAIIKNSNADHFHISTEGPLGLAARNYLKKHKLRYTTSLHTKFPEYVHERLPFIPVSLGYRFLKWFHNSSHKVLVTTKSMKQELENLGFKRLEVWGRGVNIEKFKPNSKKSADTKIPRLLYVGRVAVEKNIEAFLNINAKGQKIIVGDGPSRNALEKKYPDVTFLGYKYGEDLVEQYANADVFVFPSLTDTFGLVMLEALACGTPIAAFPVTGPLDVVEPEINGSLDKDLEKAIQQALLVDREKCREFAEANSWQICADRFRNALINAKKTNLK